MILSLMLSAEHNSAPALTTAGTSGHGSAIEHVSRKDQTGVGIPSVCLAREAVQNALAARPRNEHEHGSAISGTCYVHVTEESVPGTSMNTVPQLELRT